MRLLWVGAKVYVERFVVDLLEKQVGKTHWTM